MFNLDHAIAKWRQQMLAAGIKTPVPLEELESHLRDEIEQQVQSGLSAQQAFETATQKIGQASVLKSEFTKVGGTIQERVKHFIVTLSGVSSLQLATNMNTSNSNIEPRWATYFKNIAFILPAMFLWVCSCVFVLPKLKEICAASGMALPKLMLAALALSDLFKSHLVVLSVLLFGALAFLEWRSRWWSRYRRLCFGIAAFVLNSIALILITTLSVLAVVAGANLLHAK
jgi:hypothetical protein